MTALAAIQETPGLHDYLEELEARLEQTVGTHPGLVAAVSRDALSAGGKRLRPLLVFFATPPGNGSSRLYSPSCQTNPRSRKSPIDIIPEM